MIFAGYTALVVKNQAQNILQIQFVEIDFSKLFFQRSSTDQQVDNLNNHTGATDDLNMWHIVTLT